jgi:hypothetical protein
MKECKYNYMENQFIRLESAEGVAVYAIKIQKCGIDTIQTNWFNVKPAVMEKIKAILIAENE